MYNIQEIQKAKKYWEHTNSFKWSYYKIPNNIFNNQLFKLLLSLYFLCLKSYHTLYRSWTFLDKQFLYVICFAMDTGTVIPIFCKGNCNFWIHFLFLHHYLEIHIILFSCPFIKIVHRQWNVSFNNIFLLWKHSIANFITVTIAMMKFALFVNNFNF